MKSAATSKREAKSLISKLKADYFIVKRPDISRLLSLSDESGKEVLLRNDALSSLLDEFFNEVALTGMIEKESLNDLKFLINDFLGVEITRYSDDIYYYGDFNPISEVDYE
jgi:hypothetical protein